MKSDPKFQLGQKVFATMGGTRGVVTGILHRPGHLQYLVRWQNGIEIMHYDIELRETPVGEYQPD